MWIDATKKTMSCVKCGALYERTGRGQKYCAQCRIAVKKQYEKGRKRKGHALKKQKDDSQEQIEICLSCTLPECLPYAEDLCAYARFLKRKKKAKEAS